MANLALDVSTLTVDERLDLMEKLWDSVAAAPEQVPLTGRQADELDRRWASYQQDQDAGRPWREALDSIRRTAR